MTLDHIGIFMEKYENLREISTIFRCFGRIALPIFVFLLVQGIVHTKNIKKYFIRLGLLALVFLSGQIIYFRFVSQDISNFYNPILDLLLVGLVIFLLNKKNRWSFLSIVPIAYMIFDFVVINVEIQNMTTIEYLPTFLRLAYPLFSLLLGLLFYYSKPLSNWILLSNQNTKDLAESSYARYAQNLINCVGIIVISLGFYVLFEITGISYIFMNSQAYASLAFIPLMFYSGERGYNKNWFKYGCYLYVPLHIILIYLVFALI